MSATIYCVAANCVNRDEHLIDCADPTCTGCWPHTANHGYLCQRHFDRVDQAIQIADHLRAALRGITRAVQTDTVNAVAGPRLPLTAIQLDLDAINRAQSTFALEVWIQTEAGALEALNFARIVIAADRAHPTVERERKLHRLRCPDCKRLTATWQPPDWPGDDVHITCLSCGWTATHPDAIDIVTAIEIRGAA